jgi:hypothetical protein
LPPDFLAPLLDPPDREDDFLRPDFAVILFLPVIVVFRLRMPSGTCLGGVDVAIWPDSGSANFAAGPPARSPI